MRYVLYTYCVLQVTDLSPPAHCDRDCIRTRAAINSHQHIAAQFVCVCVCVFCMHRVVSLSYHLLYELVFKFVFVCTLLHAV